MSDDQQSIQSDEYVIVNQEPKLKIADNGDYEQLIQGMSEALDLSTEIPPSTDPEETVVMDEKGDKDVAVSEDDVLFTGVTYLGSATLNAPRSDMEIGRNMSILNQESKEAIPVHLTVPKNSDGIVYILEPESGSTIASYQIHRIIFCARGLANSPERECFAFTCSHGDRAETTIFQCHVFRCEGEETLVSKILYSFATAFRSLPPSMLEDHTDNRNTFCFDVALDIKEDDGKGGWSTCPKDKNVFKLRKDIDKQVSVCVVQTQGPWELKIDRCFGVLLCPGRNVSSSDMQLLELISMGKSSDNKSYNAVADWNCADDNLVLLNRETVKETRLFFTIALDLVLKGIQEPVRFSIEGKTRIFPSTERFWYFSKKPYIVQFILRLKELTSHIGSTEDKQFEVVSCRSSLDIEREKATLTLNLNRSISEGGGGGHTPSEPDNDNSDNDEPLMSGSGSVSKDVADENMLDGWHEVLTKWHSNLKQRPRQVHSLVRRGVPDALRGEVWQLLVGASDHAVLLEDYRILITKDSSCEQVIQRDINRTFPAHDYFKENGGAGQESLYRICKAYSVFDEEIGYCQGLSFLAAALLLHMPEEQAFCVLVKIMSEYHLRDVFKCGFETLHIKLFQLEQLLADQLPDVYSHFKDLQLEAHMYASQWFLTLFTAKFPLDMVFRILDIYLCEGSDVIFRVALTLLKTSRKELLACDFEGVLKYFRVQLPKRFRHDDASREFFNAVAVTKVSARKLSKYEKEYLAQRQAQLQQEDPLESLERENKRLLEYSMRLEQENDDLARELVTSKVALRTDLDEAEDKVDLLTKDLLQSKVDLKEIEEERRQLMEENAQLKSMFRAQQEKADEENTRNQAIIQDYKQICKQLSERLERQQTTQKEEINQLKTLISKCTTCDPLVNSANTPPTPPHPLDPDYPPVLDLAASTLVTQVRELELELAQTKLALVEAECKCQDLTHSLAQLTETLSDQGKNSWFQKTLMTLKEGVGGKKEGGAPGPSGPKALVKSFSKENVKRQDSVS